MEEKLNANVNHEKCGCKHIEGIVCDVKNCAHHNGDCYCTANQIVVGPTSATTSDATECSTFKPRTND